MKPSLMKRSLMMLIGILFIGICVAAYRLSGFGADTFSCMNLGISGFLHLSFGTWQLIINAAILVLVFFKARSCIGAGTIVNMICVGYLADFLCWFILEILQIPITLSFRIGALLLGSAFAGLGVAFYMAAEMGISPYDSVAIIIENLSHKHISFRWARIISDISVVFIGILFCLLSRGNIWQIVGIGTICNALFNGPLIQFFRTHVAEPLLKNHDSL